MVHRAPSPVVVAEPVARGSILAALGLALALAAGAVGQAAAPTQLTAERLRSPHAGPYAVAAARILTMDDARDPAVVEGGVLVVDAGRIVAVGPRATTPLPPGTPILELGDALVCPGFVDLHHHVSSGGGDINDMVTPINAELRTLDAVRPSATAIRETAAGGVTTTLFIPGSGTNLAGFGVLMKMAGDRDLDELVIEELGAMKVAQGFNPERRFGDMGLTRMGMHDLLTRALLRGKDYAARWRAFAAGGGPRPDLEPDLEQLRKVFDKEVPVIIHTAGARDCVATARMFQDVFDLRMILSHGCFDGHWAASAVAARRVPVNLGPRMYQLTRDGRMQGIAAGYWEQGCTDLSLNTDAPVIPAEQLPLQAAMAVRLGLPYEVALAAITIVPARQVGIAHRVGSLTPGKDADFLVSRGDPLDPRFAPELVFVEGRLVHSSTELR